jgi:hypothetical protein|nr:CPBP family glutamic-type intramembrane protease [Kofleriaceae bacterium]
MTTQAGPHGHGDLASSLVLVVPVLLAYEIGVVFSHHVNGADVITRGLYAVLGSRALYIAFHAAVAAAFVGWLVWTRRWSTLRADVAAPVILESAIYALTLGAVMSLVVERVLKMSLGGPGVIAALGAGVHEELVFRLALMSVVVAALRQRAVAVPIAIALSAALFALAHHANAGEPFTVHAFASRCVAGAAFALIFWYRSFAHAVYAHVFYDLVIAITS